LEGICSNLHAAVGLRHFGGKQVFCEKTANQRCKEGTQVDAHIEDVECAVFAGIFIIIQLTNHNRDIGFEETVAHNQHGQTDPKGEPRELHLDAALRLADPLSQVGEKFVQSLRRIPEISNVARGSKLVRFPPNPYYQVNILKIAQGDHVHLQIQDGYAVASVLGGALLIENQRRLLSVCTGHTMLMPAHCHTSKLSPAKSEAEIAIVVPTGVLIKVH
jgi:hypothetical protein